MMKEIKNNLGSLNLLLKEGKVSEAYEKYYSKDIVIQVNGNPAITGKEENKKREHLFLQEINKLKDSKVQSVTFGGPEDNVSMTEWAITIENKEGKEKIIHRVNVQHWKDDLIINEKLYFCGDQEF